MFNILNRSQLHHCRNNLNNFISPLYMAMDTYSLELFFLNAPMVPNDSQISICDLSILSHSTTLEYHQTCATACFCHIYEDNIEKINH